MGQNQTRCQVRIGGQTIEEIKDFTYRSDCLAVGDEAHFTAANLKKKYTGSLRVGQDVEFLLSNPQVNGGQWTTKHTGLITVRDQSADQSGSVVKITSNDLGWHLQNNAAPLWFNLRKAKFVDLVDPSRTFRDRRGQQIAFIDQSWGIKGYRVSDNSLNRLIKAGLRQGVAEVAANAQRVLDPVFAIQVDPGDSVYDVMSQYAKRINALVNVTVDKYLQIWRPDYNRKPAFKIRNVAGGRDNNVIRAPQMHEELRGQYTQVECIGNQIGYQGPQDPNNPNASKKRGSIYHPDLLPFLRRLTFSDGQMYARGLAQKAAEWRYKRELFGSWYVTYVVEGHHQDGVWYEADQLVDIEDDDLGLSGYFWCSAADYAVSKTDGDLTTLTIRKPGLLTAAFGVLPNPPTVRSSSKEASANGKVQETRP